MTPAEQITGQFVLLFFTLVLGYVHQLGIKLRGELEKRQLAEVTEQRRNAEFEAVYNASLQLTSNLELKVVLETILQQVSHVGEASAHLSISL